jgi:Tfp pilus assembly protein PilN
MIRVNLLAKEEAPKGRQLQVPAIGAFVPMFVAMAVVAVCGVMYFQQLRTYQRLQNDLAAAKEETQKLAPQIARIRQLTAEREQVDRRLDAITTLDKDRYYRVHLLSEMARKFPDNTWLTLLEEKGPNTIKIEGITFSNFTVADFMRDLAQSESYKSVDLDVLERGFIKDVRVIKFSATAHVGNTAVEVAAGN